MTRFVRVLLCCSCILSASLAACGMLIPDTSWEAGAVQPEQTPALPGVETPFAFPIQPTVGGLPASPTLEPLVLSPISAASPTVEANGPATAPPAQPCNLVQPGMPFDLSFPDDTHVSPGQYFAKTWRLVNGGSCVWDSTYSVVWFSGAQTGIYPVTRFAGEVRPGSPVDVTVEMIAPQEPGVYQSNWKLRSGDGSLFGIGPNGSSPFWVRIVVDAVELATATPTAVMVVTPTEIILSSGLISMQAGSTADLDSGLLDSSIADDLSVRGTAEGGYALQPENDARLALMGSTAPELRACLNAPLQEVALVLNDLPVGSFLCYRTTQGLPGRAYLTSVDAAEGQLEIDYTTWVLP